MINNDEILNGYYAITEPEQILEAMEIQAELLLKEIIENKAIIIEKFADNGEHSHYALCDVTDGEIIYEPKH